uniref:Uncharacterized protein AlNc14C236G9393 n=1 Tax=Albugo laibachii Nc14 TaxID=890382 RepID=F0W8C8_9STRA|nr:conserved hypothetical protein [Albugo laibachii Nc14]CCA24375.1 conserved hypothetical protein [Albugo laibachii Nc14]|eukprot:CCA24375.1 conserved hypothetical protein [Albugo laibachii Nc14]
MLPASDLSLVDSLLLLEGEIAAKIGALLQKLQAKNCSRQSKNLQELLEIVHENLQWCDAMANDLENCEVLRTSVYALWLHVVVAQLEMAAFDILNAIQYVPDAILYWKFLQRNKLRAKLEQMPTEWLLSRSHRIANSEKLRALTETLDMNLTRLGQLKTLKTTMVSMLQKPNAIQAQVVQEIVPRAVGLLKSIYLTPGISVPRRVDGSLSLETDFSDSVTSLDSEYAVAGLKFVSESDLQRSLLSLDNHICQMRDLRLDFSSSFQSALRPCRPPSKLQRRWIPLTIAVFSVGVAGVWLTRNRVRFLSIARTVREALQQFFIEHMIEPIDAIVGEILFNRKTDIQDAAALLDAKASLQRMLHDFACDTNPSMPPQELQSKVESMDMSLVSFVYEKQLSTAVRNLMTGDIVRMLLIQIQFIKKELMVAMGAIDDLMHANQLNLQLLATIPTILAGAGIYGLTKMLFFQLYKKTTEHVSYDSREVASHLRRFLRDIERLLNKQNRGSSLQIKGAEEAQWHTLDARDLGYLVLLLYQLRGLFDSHRVLFRDEDQVRFEEDLCDLLEEGLYVSQRLAVIQRMYHSYPFLNQPKLRSSWLLH